MAKNGALPVNPLRIAGACGRLMCCLKYEHPLYQKFREEAPRLGSTVESPEGPGTVVGHNVPGDSVVVKLAEDGRRCACPKASVRGPTQAYEAKHRQRQRHTPTTAGRGPSRRHTPRPPRPPPPPPPPPPRPPP